MQFHTPLQVSPRGEWRPAANAGPTGLQQEAGEDMSDEELFAAAQQMEAAITTLLHNPDPLRQQEANHWLTASCGQPVFWTIALYLAFPPAHRPSMNNLGGDVRFFALNILLSKIRADSDQLSMEAATEIYETLVRQLPTITDPVVRSRLCIVIGAAAALSGPNICYEMVESMEREAEYPVAVELLTALAEEALLRSRALPREVLECLQDCCPKVIRLLHRGLSGPSLQSMPAPVLAKSLVCLARWKNAGLTLSELHREHPALHQVLLLSLGSPHCAVYEAAAGVLTELISEVDILPGRDEAVRATIQGVLAQASAVHSDPMPMVELVSAIGTAEAGLLAQGQEQELLLLQWLLRLTAGDTGPPTGQGAAAAGLAAGLAPGEGRDMGAASMAAEVWPRISRVGKARRGPALQSGELFKAALQAVLQAAVVPSEDDLDTDADDFQRFREGPASEALQACHRELGVGFLDAISAHLQGASSWEALEVAVYAAGAVSAGVLHSAGLGPQDGGGPEAPGRPAAAAGAGGGGGAGGAGAEGAGVEEKAATEFMSRLFWGLPGAQALASRDDANMPNPSLVSTALRTAALYAPFCVHSPPALEAGVVYSVGALRIPQARGQAACTLQALCVAAAPSLAAARALAPLMQQCEEAVASVAVQGGMEEQHRVAVVQGLASVAAMLPLPEAQAALAHLAGSAVATLQRAAPLQEKSEQTRQELSAALRVLTCLIEAVSGKLLPAGGGGDAPAAPAAADPSAEPSGSKAEALLLPLLQGAWPSVDAVAASWADDATVGAALCSLWGVTARAMGSQLSSVLPQVIAAAGRMFESSRHAACLLCLSDILGMPRVGARSSPQVEAALGAVPPIVLAALPALQQALHHTSTTPTRQARRRSGGSVGAGSPSPVGFSPGSSPSPAPGDAQQREHRKEQHRRAADTLAAAWHLMLAYVAHSPQLLLPTPAFGPLCQSATLSLRSDEPELAHSAALFLADSMVGQPLEDLKPGQVPLPLGPTAEASAQVGDVGRQQLPNPKWRLTPELIPPVDAMCASLGSTIVEEVLSSLVHERSSQDVVAAHVDLLYALCVRHPRACEAAITALLQSPASPLKCGELSRRHLDLFLAAATRQPPHTRQRFHDLMNDFSKVANRLMPAEVFEGY